MSEKGVENALSEENNLNNVKDAIVETLRQKGAAATFFLPSASSGNSPWTPQSGPEHGIDKNMVFHWLANIVVPKFLDIVSILATSSRFLPIQVNASFKHQL